MSDPESDSKDSPSYTQQCRKYAVDYLHERGVLEETLKKCEGEIDPFISRDTIAERLNRPLPQVRADKTWGPVKAILWFRAPGWVARALPPYSRKAKFLAANGSDGAPWIPRETLEVAKDAGVPVVITEGPVKTMVLLQAGAFSISVLGIWGATTREKAKSKKAKVEPPSDKDDEGEGWKSDGAGGEDDDDAGDDPLGLLYSASKVKLRGWLAYFQWYRRAVYLAFDADKRKNPNVRQAEIRTWLALHSAGGDVFVLGWPLEEGKGIDDYLAGKAGTNVEKQREVFAELRKAAAPFLDTLDPHDLPTILRELRRMSGDRPVIEELAKKIARKLGVTKNSLLPKLERGGEEGGSEGPPIPPTATAWEKPVKALEVIEEVRSTILRFVWVRRSHALVAALWIVLTYLHDAVDILPLFLISSPEEDCGKSTLLKTILFLSNRPIPAANVSAAAIYRTIKDDCPTFVLDEAETYLATNEELRGVIDSGHEREFAYVIRTMQEGEGTIRFPTWCPKVLAMISLPKRTILSRSVHVRLVRKGAEVKLEKLKKKHREELENLRSKISRLANDIREKVRGFESDFLINRANDNWQPLRAIAHVAGQDLEREVEKAAMHMTSKDAQDSKSEGRYLLESLAEIVKTKREEQGVQPPENLFLRSLDLVNMLNSDLAAPWKDNNKELSAHRLGKILSGYEVKADQKRVEKSDQKRAGDSKTASRGYWANDIEKAVEKWIPKPDENGPETAEK